MNGVLSFCYHGNVGKKIAPASGFEYIRFGERNTVRYDNVKYRRGFFSPPIHYIAILCGKFFFFLLGIFITYLVLIL